MLLRRFGKELIFMAFLNISRISFNYGEQRIIRNLSLSLERGKRLGVVGSSGSGKTTLMRILAGELRPAEGGISLDGVPFADQLNDRVPGHPSVSLMAQDFNLDPNLSVDDNIIRNGRHLSTTNVKRYLGKVHRAFQLGAIKSQKVRTLSGGQKQRAALAAALLSSNELLLLDEPFSQMDYALKQNILQFLEEEPNLKTVIMVGHEPTDLMRYCDQIAVLEKGRVLQLAPVEQIYHFPKNERVAALTGMYNKLDQQAQELTGIFEALFRPLHCRLEEGGDWTLEKIEYHAFGQIGTLVHSAGISVKAQIPLEGHYQIGSLWRLRIKKP